MGELLQRDGSVGVVIGFRELVGDIGRRVARLPVRPIRRCIQSYTREYGIDLLARHLGAIRAAALSRAGSRWCGGWWR